MIERELGAYDLRFTTSFALYEFKVTVLAQCVFLHNLLVRKGSYAQALYEVVESHYYQSKLRVHILNNLVGVFPPGRVGELSREDDSRLAELAALELENVIDDLDSWPTSHGSDGVLKDIDCTRAEERVQKGRKFITLQMPICNPRNRRCSVNAVVQARATSLVEHLETIIPPAQPDSTSEVEKKGKKDPWRQLRGALPVLREMSEGRIANPNWRSHCRKMGDCLIALEAAPSVDAAVSTNASEWQHLCACPDLDLDFHHLRYPWKTNAARASQKDAAGAGPSRAESPE